MSVCITSKHIYVQFIDDVKRVTLAAASTVTPELKGGKGRWRGRREWATRSAECEGEENHRGCVDRGGLRYHGRVKALADAAREAGLNFNYGT